MSNSFGNTMFFEGGIRSAQLYRFQLANTRGKTQHYIYVTVKLNNPPALPRATTNGDMMCPEGGASVDQTTTKEGRHERSRRSVSTPTQVQKHTKRTTAPPVGKTQSKKQKSNVDTSPNLNNASLVAIHPDELVSMTTMAAHHCWQVQQQPVAMAMTQASEAGVHGRSVTSGATTMQCTETRAVSPFPAIVSGHPLVQPIFSFWDSTEAHNLFGKLPTESDARQAIESQLEILLRVNRSERGHLDIVEEEIIQNAAANNLEVTSVQKWSIRQKAQYLSLALHYAKEHMNAWTWAQCCHEAVQQLKLLSGITLANHARTVQEWYRQFRETRMLRVMVKKNSNSEGAKGFRPYCRVKLPHLRGFKVGLFHSLTHFKMYDFAKRCCGLDWILLHVHHIVGRIVLGVHYYPVGWQCVCGRERPKYYLTTPSYHTMDNLIVHT